MKNQPDISNEQIVLAYMDGYFKGEKMVEIAERLGMPYSSFVAKVAYMRKHGVELPRYNNKEGLDKKKLNGLIRKYYQ